MLKKEEIKKLIQKGYDINLISFKLEIPIDRLRGYEKEVREDNISKQVPKQKTNQAKQNDVQEKGPYIDTKIEQMKERYKKLFLGKDPVHTVKIEPLSEKQIQIVETALQGIRERIQELDGLPQKERRPIFNDIIKEWERIGRVPLSIEQAERFNDLMKSEQLDHLKMFSNDKIDFLVNKLRKHAETQVIKAIERKLYQECSLDELTALQEKITLTLIKENPAAGSVKNKILNKIVEIQQKNAVYKIRNNVPENIRSVTEALTKGSISTKDANRIIEEEVRKKVADKPKAKFGLSEEQKKKQMLAQMRMLMTENANQYPIQNPKDFILQVQDLYECDWETAIRIVIKNLTGRKEYEMATRICDQYMKKETEGSKRNETIVYIRNLKKKIKNIQFGDSVSEMLNRDQITEEDRTCFKGIEEMIDSEMVKLGAIPLGKSKDGLRTITLASIWGEDKEKVH